MFMIDLYFSNSKHLVILYNNIRINLSVSVDVHNMTGFTSPASNGRLQIRIGSFRVRVD